MSILDLQGLQAPSEVRANAHSGASKNCFNFGGGGHISTLSLLVC